MRLAIVTEVLASGDRKILTVLPGKVGDPLGVLGEARVHEMLNELGIESTQMPPNCPFDIFTKNGVLIEVKAATRSISRVGKYSYDYYAFSIKKRWAFHFIIVWAVNDNEYYIIPARDIKTSGVKRIYPNASKWKKYKDNWEVLKQWVEL